MKKIKLLRSCRLKVGDIVIESGGVGEVPAKLFTAHPDWFQAVKTPKPKKGGGDA